MFPYIFVGNRRFDISEIIDSIYIRNRQFDIIESSRGMEAFDFRLNVSIFLVQFVRDIMRILYPLFFFF